MTVAKPAAATLLLLLLTGCAAPPPAPVAPPAAPQSLLDAPGPEPFTLAEFLPRFTAYLNAEPAPAATRLGALYDRWWGGKTPAHGPQRMEGDFNGDGAPEVITAIGGLKDAKWVLFAVSGKPGSYQVDSFAPELAPAAEGFLYTAAPVAAADLNGDGKRDFVWLLNTVVGAAGARGYLVTGTWASGQFAPLGKTIHMPNPTAQSLDGNQLVISGGLAGPAGGRALQRPRTDTYRWTETGWRLADRQFAASPLGYHRPLDGIVAEAAGRTADAEQAYREAAEPDRPAVDDAKRLTKPEQIEQFTGAVRVLARLRLGALRHRLGDEAGARTALAGYTGPFAEMLSAAPGEVCVKAESAANLGALAAALNLPDGYGNPEWQPQNLCGSVTFPGLE